MKKLQWHEPAAYRRAIARRDARELIWHGVTLRFWSWDKIEYATEAHVELDGQAYRTLVLHDANGQKLETFGLRDSPTLDEISQFLNDQGKALR